MNPLDLQTEHAPNTPETAEESANRRDFLRWSAAGFLLGWPLLRAVESKAAETATAESAKSTAPPVVQPPLPVVDARFPSQIAKGIWVICDKRIPLVPNIGIVEGDRMVLVIDSGFTSQSGRNVLQAARKIAGRRSLVLTSTHAHPEHFFGSQAFKGEAKIYINALQSEYLARDGENLLQGFRPLLPPERRYLLDDIRITAPDEVYQGRAASLDLGNRRVEFRNWGIAHSPGDQIIHVPDQKVIFAGDLIEERMFPIVPLFPPMIRASDINLSVWETALAETVGLGPRILVPGHGNLGGTEIAANVLGYFAQIRQLVASAKASGMSESETVRRLEPRVQRLHPTWERSEFIAPALRFLSQRS